MKLDIQLSGSAAALVSLALNLGDPYSASAVHVIAAGKVRRKLEEIMFSKRRDALALARWEHTPASVLEALCGASDEAIVVRLDKNQNTPAQAISKLYVAESLGSKRLSSKSGSGLTVLVAQHRHASLAVLKSIAQFESDEASLLAVSKNLAANSEVLSMLLSRFESSSILEALQKNISEHPSTSPQLLEQLYDKGDVYVKAAVIGHTNCSQRLIDQAVQEESVLIQRQLAADRRLSNEVISRLSLHQDKSVRCSVASNLSASKDVIKSLATDDSDVVRRAVASRSDLTAHSINSLINDPDVWVRQKLARNSIVPYRVLAKLSQDLQADVRRGVARNAKCSVKLLRVLAQDEDYWVRSAVAYQRRAPKQLLVELAEDTAVDVLSGVANNPNTPQKLLKKLTASTEADVRRGVILNQSAKRLTLLPLLEDAYYLHRLMLVANTKLKDKDKWHLCFDPDFQVRFTAFRYFANSFIKSSY
ncbi:hypothetical protein [Methylotenera versatilis]|uniref:Leucine-rich repeat-containing protein n=1 Tax=Methylotenera versatilis (strain 301) TaxID=666681 RepID=D7DI96_METV0|nr:hypothetical protein [Methylotenera versatilis]ADI29781.1 leucine-rich repeat-containing protein [Methylotenera versatilis 301]